MASDWADPATDSQRLNYWSRGEARRTRPLCMRLIVNGSPFVLAEGLRVADLLQQIQLTGKRLAVEVNGQIVPRSLHTETMLHDEDRVEIVQAIGGG